MTPSLDSHDLVGQYEAELDRLEQSIERCRKTALVARAIAVGGACLLVSIVLRPDGPALVLGVAGVLGGLVLAGSTRTTRQQLLTRMAAVESARADLIDRIVSGVIPTPERAAPDP